MTHYARIITLLEQEQPRSRAQIMQALQMTGSVVDRVLSELMLRKQIRRVSQGVYAMPSKHDRPIRRIYLAGPMSGLPELNFPAFHRMAARLRAQGYEVVNPAEINANPDAEWLECMRADIKQLVDCDTVAVLPGWSASRGASLEVDLARRLGFNVVWADGLQEVQ